MAKENKLVRVLRVLDFIRSRKRGATIQQLCRALDVKRTTVRRYVDILIEAHVPLQREEQGQELRIRYVGKDGRTTMPSTAELFALASARQLLQSLEGTAAVAWLDSRVAERAANVSMEAAAGTSVEHAREIERALTAQQQLRIVYWGARDAEARARIVEPLELRFAQRAWYLLVREVALDELRTLKLARMQSVTMLDAPVQSVQGHGDTSTQVSVWDSKDKYDVVVRIYPPQARFAHEYPLTPTQTLSTEGDTVVVRARVSGLYEVTRWVLRWGALAKVESPAELVAELRRELAGALGRYGPPDPF